MFQVFPDIQGGSCFISVCIHCLSQCNTASLACSTLPDAAQNTTGHLCTLPAHVQVVPSRTPRSFLNSCLSAGLSSCPGASGCSTSGAGLVQFLLNTMKLLSAHCTSMSRSLWRAAQPFGKRATLPLLHQQQTC